MAGLRVILHDLPGADLSIDINLPEYYFLLYRGAQQVVVDCLGNLQIRKMFAEEPDKVRVEGEGAFQVFMGNIVGLFLRLVGLRQRKWIPGFGIRL